MPGHHVGDNGNYTPLHAMQCARRLMDSTDIVGAGPLSNSPGAGKETPETAAISDHTVGNDPYRSSYIAFYSRLAVPSLEEPGLLDRARGEIFDMRASH